MEITINGNVTINTQTGIQEAAAAEAGVSTTEERPLLDRTNEVLIDNGTSFTELIRILSGKAEAKEAAQNEAELREQEAKEEKLRKIYGEDYDIMVDRTEAEKTTAAKPKRRPGARQLRNYEPRVAKINIDGDSTCEAYANGYAVYDNGDRKTVIWIPDCGSFTYYFNPLRENEKLYLTQKNEIGEDVMGSLPWYQAIILHGEDQIWANMDHPKSVGTSSDADENYPDVKPAYRWVCGCHFDNPEEAYIKKEEAEERRKALSDKKREAYELYYEQGYNQYEIADMLGISVPAVFYRLEGAHKVFRANPEKFFSDQT